jgi:hypothetical protein
LITENAAHVAAVRELGMKALQFKAAGSATKLIAMAPPVAWVAAGPRSLRPRMPVRHP